jgi:hypothetical protein
MTPGPERLLVAARTITNRPEALAARSSWARASALLARQALELAVERFWAAHAPGLIKSHRSTQLLCLPWYMKDPAAARTVHQTWAALSSACHHHTYDLAPTALEMSVLFEEVEQALTALRVAEPA